MSQRRFDDDDGRLSARSATEMKQEGGEVDATHLTKQESCWPMSTRRGGWVSSWSFRKREVGRIATELLPVEVVVGVVRLVNEKSR